MNTLFRNAVIVLFLLSEVGDIVKTKLVKLLFLADYKAREGLGRKISNFEYVRYLYGPYPRDIETVLAYLEAKGVIGYEERINQRGDTYYLIYPKRSDFEESLKAIPHGKEVAPSEEEKAILHEIAEAYGQKSLEEILEEVYDMGVLKEVPFAEPIL